jgi:hypothetical protein
METMFKLSTTQDYSLFELAKNRSINSKEVEKKRKSIEKIGLQSPIIVNRSYEIVDGQHRFEALKQLNMPIDFLISYNWKKEEDTATINNTQKGWNTENWAEFRASQGNKQIKEALELAKNYSRLTDGKMSVTTALEMLSSAKGFGISKLMKRGDYEYNHEMAQEIYQILNIISEYPNSLRNPYNQKMVRAMKVIKHDLGYINKKAIRRMASKNFIVSYNNEGDLVKYLKKIYNQAK